MLIIGAKGFAKEVLEIVWQQYPNGDICFYDDVTDRPEELLFHQFRILKSLEEATEYFLNVDKSFTIGIGRPHLRFKLFEKFTSIGGEFVTTISNKASIGSFEVHIGEGCNILAGVQISNDVKIGKGTMIYYNCIITHDVKIGVFCEISPGATLLGRVVVGDFVHIGAGAIIFPDVVIGDNAVIAAGAVVRNNVDKNTMVAGVPANVKKTI